MQLIEDSQWIRENYRPIYFCDLESISRKSKTGEKDHCKFCKKKHPEVSFNNESHLFPQFIGNKYLLANDECDRCNEKFGRTIENEFANFIKIFHNIYGVKGQKKFPTYKKNNIRLERNENHFDLIGIDEGLISTEGGKLFLETDPFIPLSIYKCLVKMALSLINKKHFEIFEKTFEWLQDETNEVIKSNAILPLYFSQNCEEYIFNTQAYLLERKGDSDKLPSYIFKIYYSIFSFQVLLPFNKSDGHNSYDLVNFKSIPNNFELDDPLKTTRYYMDCNIVTKSILGVTIEIANLAQTQSHL
ncbi:HNH endonuclease [Kaistella pullorum]|uniref:HNH endonuclease 5 domain-containing protein n=1 Tax=Kaistella pullorum TaxID=2763074 RepID=A0ABR8WPZ3_9FLAO|nr:HNH endonuclease [Kaistella pullorum]MBD8019089.1 hypothetical protein [Kaistella pullorum]